MCSASRTSTGWAQPDVAQGSGRERGASFCSSVNQRGLYRDMNLRGNILTTKPPPATQHCADDLLDEDNKSRLVVIQTAEMSCLCVLALQLEARRRRHVHFCSSVSPAPPLPGAIACIQPLLWIVRLQFPAEFGQ